MRLNRYFKKSGKIVKIEKFIRSCKLGDWYSISLWLFNDICLWQVCPVPTQQELQQLLLPILAQADGLFLRSSGQDWCLYERLNCFVVRQSLNTSLSPGEASPSWARRAGEEDSQHLLDLVWPKVRRTTASSVLLSSVRSFHFRIYNPVSLLFFPSRFWSLRLYLLCGLELGRNLRVWQVLDII